MARDAILKAERTDTRTLVLEAAKKVLRHEAKIADIEKELVQSHLQRLHKGTVETFETSSIHLELLTSLRWINHYTAQMVESLSV